jgi:catechol 2,3-dioxygenase-like lactoylglutathione lyase family enzyme
MNIARGLSILFLSIFCLLPAQAARAGEAGISVQRPTLTVSDLDRSLIFYRDILGFTVRSITPYETPALRKIFHIEAGAGSRLVLLDASDSQPRALAMVHAPGLETDYESNLLHAPAVVINTRQLDDIHLRMAEAGFDVLLPPTPLLDFSGQPMGREAAYVDPDGIRIVLFQSGAGPTDAD